jgi:uncharacterized protein
MSTEKPSQNEDEYFARQEAELLKQQRLVQAQAARNAERKTHLGKCPRCGADLETLDLHGVQIDRCPEDNGMWLDAGEFEQLAKHQDPGFMGRVLGEVFRSLKRK